MKDALVLTAELQIHTGELTDVDIGIVLKG